MLNTWLAFEVEAAAEAAALAEQLGIDGDVLSDALAGSPLISPFAAAKLTKMQAEDDRPDFSLGWALKDLELTASTEGSGPLPVAAAIVRRWRRLAGDGLADRDVSAARIDLRGARRVGGPLGRGCGDVS